MLCQCCHANTMSVLILCHCQTLSVLPSLCQCCRYSVSVAVTMSLLLPLCQCCRYSVSVAVTVSELPSLCHLPPICQCCHHSVTKSQSKSYDLLRMEIYIEHKIFCQLKHDQDWSVNLLSGSRQGRLLLYPFNINNIVIRTSFHNTK